MSSFGGVTGDKTGRVFFTLDERPVRGLRLRDRITGGLASMIRALAIMAMVHYLRLTFDTSLYTRVDSKTATERFGDLTDA